jgi:hypothetical protein
MNFTVTYRGSDGALRMESIEAANRSDCFARCKERGIAVVELTVDSGKLRVRKDESRRVGDNAPYQSRTKSTPKLSTLNSKLSTILAVLLLVVGCGVWFWIQSGKGDADGRKCAPAEEKDKDRGRKPKTDRPVPAAAAVTNAAPATNIDARVQKPKEERKTISIHTNNLGKVVEKWIDAQGRKRMSVRYARKPVFDNASDDQLAMAVGGGGTQAIAPIPMTAASEAEFLKSLERPIMISEDDSEQVKRLKEAVRDARKAMKRMMDEGKTYNEALAEHQKLVNENVDTRNQCAAELKALVDAGDKAGAEQYIRTMNIALEQMGIEPLEMPLSRDELNAARERRMRERQTRK